MYTPIRTSRHTRFLLAAVVALTLAAVWVPVASATPYLSYWSRSGCGKPISDPLNVEWFDYYYGPRDLTNRVIKLFHWGLGWRDSSGTTQYIHSGICRQQSMQRSLGFNDKHHARLFTAYDPADPNRQSWLGYSDAHREYLGNCGKIVAGVVVPWLNHVIYDRINNRSGWQQGAYEVVHGLVKTGAVRRIPSWRAHQGPIAMQQCGGRKPAAVFDGWHHTLVLEYRSWP